MSKCQYSKAEYGIIAFSKGGCKMDYRIRLRNIREDRDVSQKVIGEILSKSQQGYNHIETGRAELKIEDLVKLCRYYNLSADYLIGLIDTPRSL